MERRIKVTISLGSTYDYNEEISSCEIQANTPRVMRQVMDTAFANAKYDFYNDGRVESWKSEGS